MNSERLAKIKAMAAEGDSVSSPIAYELAEEVDRLNLQVGELKAENTRLVKAFNEYGKNMEAESRMLKQLNDNLCDAIKELKDRQPLEKPVDATKCSGRHGVGQCPFHERGTSSLKMECSDCGAPDDGVAAHHPSCVTQKRKDEANYRCLTCDWVATSESRPRGLGILVGCPKCGGDAEYR